MTTTTMTGMLVAVGITVISPHSPPHVWSTQHSGLLGYHDWLGTGGRIVVDAESLRPIVPNPLATQNSISSVSEDIDHIKAALKITTSELADYLGVSRQAIYNWKSGEHRKSDNISKLENLMEAAKVLATAQISVSPLVLNRKLPGGKTLRETIAVGGDGREAAQSLVHMVRREGEQRKAMLGSIVGRKPVRPNEIAGGMSAFRERG